MTDSNLRQRKKGQDKTTKDTAFTQHAKKDSALREPTDQDADTQKKGGLTILGRVTVFLGFPTMMGIFSLYLGYMKSKTKGSERKVDFDTDFVFPFLLSLSVVIVVGFQTKGFSTTEKSPLVTWPKVIRKKKIIHKRVIVDDDDDEEGTEEQQPGREKRKKVTRKEE